MESPTIEGDSPVDETVKILCLEYPSSVGHEKSCVNLGGPPPKAKYYLTTDSALVP
jgi:hypothetical protein